MKENKTQSIFISVVSLISRTSFNIERQFKSEKEFETVHAYDVCTHHACTSGRCKRQSEFPLLHFTIFH